MYRRQTPLLFKSVIINNVIFNWGMHHSRTCVFSNSSIEECSANCFTVGDEQTSFCHLMKKIIFVSDKMVLAWRSGFFRKGSSFTGTTSFGVFCVQICQGVWAVASCKIQKKNLKLVIHRARQNSVFGRAETPQPIATKFFLSGTVHDVMTHANFGEDQLRGLDTLALLLAWDDACRRL